MAIENKFLLFAKTATFEAKRTAGEIKEDSIVFIKEKGQIFTHGAFYSDLSQVAALSGVLANLTAAQVKFDATEGFTAATVQAAIEELAGKIKATQEGAKSYSIVKVSGTLAANVKEAYQLTETIGETTSNVGEVINIYKDSAVQSAQVGHMGDTIDASGVIVPGEGADCIEIVYLTANGGYDLVQVNVADFLRETEFTNGLEVLSGAVSVKVDAESEEFLTVGEGGLKLSGVADAISGALSDALASVEELSGVVDTLSENVTSGFAFLGWYIEKGEETTTV